MPQELGANCKGYKGATNCLHAGASNTGRGAFQWALYHFLLFSTPIKCWLNEERMNCGLSPLTNSLELGSKISEFARVKRAEQQLTK